LEEAPEPNDIDWEFIYYPTSTKIWCRIKAWLITILFETATFVAFYIISLWLAKETEYAHDQ
jgi:predicted Co/Zn/Cd cation transporter (cation efflux family)